MKNTILPVFCATVLLAGCVTTKTSGAPTSSATEAVALFENWCIDYVGNDALRMDALAAAAQETPDIRDVSAGWDFGATYGLDSVGLETARAYTMPGGTVEVWGAAHETCNVRTNGTSAEYLNSVHRSLQRVTDDQLLEFAFDTRNNLQIRTFIENGRAVMRQTMPMGPLDHSYSFSDIETNVTGSPALAGGSLTVNVANSDNVASRGVVMILDWGLLD